MAKWGEGEGRGLFVQCLLGHGREFAFYSIRNIRAYSFSTATVTNYHTLVLKLIHDYYLPAFGVRSLKWVSMG